MKKYTFADCCRELRLFSCVFVACLFAVVTAMASRAERDRAIDDLNRRKAAVTREYAENAHIITKATASLLYEFDGALFIVPDIHQEILKRPPFKHFRILTKNEIDQGNIGRRAAEALSTAAIVIIISEDKDVETNRQLMRFCGAYNGNVYLTESS